MSRLLRHNVASRANATPGAEKGRRAVFHRSPALVVRGNRTMCRRARPELWYAPWQTARHRNVCKRENNVMCAGHILPPRSIGNIPRGGGCPAPRKFRAKFLK